MNRLYQRLIRPVLFQMQAENAHEQILAMLSTASNSHSLTSMLHSFHGSPALGTSIKHLTFPNPLGLAAGMDKNAIALPIWQNLGFGFCEIGGVTLHAQPGNPKPRMFRALETNALINRMGFNNDGLEAVLCRLNEWKTKKQWPSSPVAINLGKSKITPLDEAPEEYAQLLKALWTLGDLFVVNVSSPNTPDLRKLQQTDSLNQVLQALESAQLESNKNYPSLPNRPIFLKIDPDMPIENLNNVLDAVMNSSLEGMVATNTTLARPEGEDQSKIPTVYSETGGLSGKPLQQRSTDHIRHIYSYTKGKLTIIGVGGIFDARDAWEKIGAGASLIQAYSGMVYQGPGMARTIVEGLQDQVELHGLNSIRNAVGKELSYIEQE